MSCQQQAVSPTGAVALQQNDAGPGQMMIVDFVRLFQVIHASEDEVRGLDNDGAKEDIARKLAGLAHLPPSVQSCAIIESIALGHVVTRILLNGDN